MSANKKNTPAKNVKNALYFMQVIYMGGNMLEEILIKNMWHLRGPKKQLYRGLPQPSGV